jgi:hypothetical protein
MDQDSLQLCQRPPAQRGNLAVRGGEDRAKWRPRGDPAQRRRQRPPRHPAIRLRLRRGDGHFPLPDRSDPAAAGKDDRDGRPPADHLPTPAVRLRRLPAEDQVLRHRHGPFRLQAGRRWPGGSHRRLPPHRTDARLIRQRKAWVEPVFGDGKGRRGLRRARCRGLDAVRIQALLTATAQNIRTLALRRPAWPCPMGRSRPDGPLQQSTAPSTAIQTLSPTSATTRPSLPDRLAPAIRAHVPEFGDCP